MGDESFSSKIVVGQNKRNRISPDRCCAENRDLSIIGFGTANRPYLTGAILKTAEGMPTYLLYFSAAAKPLLKLANGVGNDVLADGTKSVLPRTRVITEIKQCKKKWKRGVWHY